jgi:signal transduction histidine kinase
MAMATIVPVTTRCALHRLNGEQSASVPGIATIGIVPYRKVDDPAKLRRLMDAVLMLEADIELPVLLRHLVEEACSLVDARYGALGVLNEARTGLERFVTVGLSDVEERAIGARPAGRGVLGLMISEPETLRLTDLTSHPDSYGFPDCHPPMTSFLGVPLRSRGEVFGNLYLTDKQGADDFNDEDAALAEALALAAGVAIENTRLHDQVRVLSVLDDRVRIARDLHDRVVQRIFAVGMALQSAMRLPELDLVVDRVRNAVEDLDATITEIRTTIFELGDSTIHGGLRHGVLGLTKELAPSLGSRPDVVFDGPIDNAIPQHIADHLLAVLRESLTNAGKHAQATKFVVTLSVGTHVILEVSDNGRGITLPLEGGAGLGLSNLRDRAEELGGTFEIRSVPSGGTRVIWCVPV